MSDGESAADAAVRPARSVAIATIASRVLGLVRDKATVYFFPGLTADALYLAWTIPNLFRRFFGEGALSAALVPVLAETERREGREGRNRVARSVIWSLIALLVPLTLVLLLTLTVVPERAFFVLFQSDEMARVTLRLLRWTLPYLVFICVAGQMQAVANLAGRFFLPALTPAFGNVTWIAGAVVAGLLAHGAATAPDPTWVAIGMLAGGALQVFCQWLELLRVGENCLAPAPIRTREVTEISRRMTPMLLGMAAGQINVLVDPFVAQKMIEGSHAIGAVTQLNLATRLMQFPLGVVGVALGTAVYPALARAAARNDTKELGHALGSALRTATTLCLPAIFGLVALAGPIMGLLFEGGKFGAEAAEASGSCMAAFAPTLLFQTAVLLLARAEYARGNQRRPVVVSLVAIGVNTVLDFVFVIPFGAPGIAAVTSIAAFVNVWLLMRGLRLDGFDARRELWLPALRVLAPSAAMFGAVVLVRLGVEHCEVARWTRHLGVALPLRSAVIVGGGIAVGLAVFFGVARLVARAELGELMRLLRQRRTRRSPALESDK
jgi:putative peptidoglycan lipid II flippase